MQQIYDVLILGGGAAGYTAALYAARAGLRTVVLEKLSPGGQMATTDRVDNYPGFPDGIDGFTLGMQMQAGAEKYGAKTEYTEILSASLADTIKEVMTDMGTFWAKTVVIATGASPKKLGLAEEEALTGKGVHYCAHCDGRFYKDKIAVVVGGGNSAVSDALYLAHLCKKVYLVHRRDSLRATKIYHDQLAKTENLEILWNSRVKTLLHDDRVKGVVLERLPDQSERELRCDGVFISIGRTPDTLLFAKEVSLDENGYVLAGEDTQTNLQGVFAAGDVRTKALRQIITAASDGAVAATMAQEYVIENPV